MLKIKNYNSAFTLLEILLVVGIIAVLAGIVIVAINPSRQLATARDAERRSDLKQINSALLQYYIDNQEFPDSVTGNTLTEICNSGSGDGTDCLDETIDLSVLVPRYLSAIPTDPNGYTATTTGYHIALNSSHKPYLKAPNTEVSGTYIAIGSGTGVTNPCDHSASNSSCWSTQSNNHVWGPFEISGSSQNVTLSNGKANTAILAGKGADYDAAYYCYNLTEDGVSVGTWYLPSYKELWAGWNALGTDVFPSGAYWSSTEQSSEGLSENFAWFLFDDFLEGHIMHYMFKSNEYYVRCLR
jgi:prepilin-type N-terminal cleavage/methylation domain-containing protein